MYEFSYHRPASVADAASLLASHEDAKLLAGGQTYLPTLKQRLAQPSDLIDLGGIAELKGIKEEGGGITIGAMTRHADVAHSEVVKRVIPALAALAREAMESAAARYRAAIRPWARLKLARALLQEALNRFRERAQAPMITKASAYFALVTGGDYERLITDDIGGQPVLCALRAGGARVTIDEMSEGTADQLYLALRLAALLGQHSVLVSDLMRARIRGDSDLAQAANAALGQNTQALAEVLQPAVDAAALRVFGKLWAEHILSLFDYARGHSIHDQAVRDHAREESVRLSGSKVRAHTPVA